MQADRSQLQLAFQSPAVERLDVLQFVGEAIRTGVDLVIGQRVKHECIIGIRAVPHMNRNGIWHGTEPNDRPDHYQPTANGQHKGE